LRAQRSEAIHSFFLLLDGLLRFARNDELKVLHIGCLKIESALPVSFRGDAKHRTRNLEIPGLVLAHHPGMTILLRFARNDG
jgi:hypothetical protein